MMTGCLLMKENNIIQNALQSHLNNPIPVSSICKKPKHRQEKHKLKHRWKGLEVKQWRCTTAMMWEKLLRPCLLNLYISGSIRIVAVILIFNDQYVAEVWTARSTPGGIAKLDHWKIRPGCAQNAQVFIQCMERQRNILSI